ncbi:KMO family protein [Megaselia abdita]
MKGRMTHDLQGNTKEILYDPLHGQGLFSVGRKYLNEKLLNLAEKNPNIHMHFEKKLVTAKLDNGDLIFKDLKTNVDVKENADLIVGCDGAYSQVRAQMIKRPGFSFSQQYIRHGYLELCIPAKDGEFQMPPNYLHIWPRHSFMMIALPNKDKSFTVTLSMPFETFESIQTENDLLDFFDEHYPDATALIGKDRLLKDFFKSKPQHMVSIKCNSYNIGSKAVILGDAAHAMVPYYGQGMNCGFEDCTLLDKILSQSGITINDALKQFSESRWEDANAMCDLAMYNYIEMRDLVTKRTFFMRKKIDEFLHCLMPDTWVPLYNSVSFSNMPYTKCIDNRKWQDNIYKNIILVVCALVVAQFIILLYSYLN